MAKSEHQKAKLCHLAEILAKYTDEEHGMTTSQLINALAALGIGAERKSIYDDIRTLQDFGMDIVTRRSKTTEYFLASREFELPELKLLVDAISASRFVTKKKSLALIEKLEKLTSVHEAGKLRRQLVLTGRSKSQNERIFALIDALHTAIHNNAQVRFYYTEYTPQKTKVYRHDHKCYQISPWALCWDDENYYLVAFDAQREQILHYRVDRMEQIQVVQDCPRLGQRQFEQFDMAGYAKQTFGMFGGTPTKVTLRFQNRLAGVVIDRFGEDVFLVPREDGSFTATVNVTVSPVFLGWVASFGSEVCIVSPDSVKQDLCALLRSALQQYQ